MALLGDLKNRLHIYHSVEDDFLQNDILAPSIDAIARMTGINKDSEDPQFKELVLERGRYAYNDQLEFFEDNFRSELLGLSSTLLKSDEEGGSDGGS